MGRPRSPKAKIRPTAEILRAFTVLFTGTYNSIELPDEVEGMLIALAWILGVPAGSGPFEAALCQVRESLRVAGISEPEIVQRAVPITNAREQQEES